MCVLSVDLWPEGILAPTAAHIRQKVSQAALSLYILYTQAHVYNEAFIVPVQGW